MKGLGSWERGNGEGVGGGEGGGDGMDLEEWEVDLGLAQLRPLPTSSGGSLNTMGLRRKCRIDVQCVHRNIRAGQVRIRPSLPLNYPILHLQYVYWQLQVGWKKRNMLASSSWHTYFVSWDFQVG